MASYYVLGAASPLAKGCSAYLNLCPIASYYVLAAASPLAMDEGCPSLSTPGSAEGGYLNLWPVAARPLAKGEGCPSLSTPGSAGEGYLNLCPMASYYVQAAAASPLSKNDPEGPSPTRSLSTPGSAEERHLNPFATLGHAASVSAPTGCQSLTTPGLAGYSPCL